MDGSQWLARRKAVPIPYVSSMLISKVFTGLQEFGVANTWPYRLSDISLLHFFFAHTGAWEPLREGGQATKVRSPSAQAIAGTEFSLFSLAQWSSNYIWMGTIMILGHCEPLWYAIYHINTEASPQMTSGIFLWILMMLTTSGRQAGNQGEREAVCKARDGAMKSRFP